MSSAVGDTSSRWLNVLKGTDDRGAKVAAARVVWERYFDRLVRLARHWLRNARTGMSDEEDVALSAIKSFRQRVAEGKFPRLDDRHDLWRILVTIAALKAAGAYRRKSPSTRDDELLDQIIGTEPSPELAAEVADQLRRLLVALPNEGFHTIALMKLEGYNNAEIAEDLGCSTKNVEYELRNIRATWLPVRTEE
jgi:DNA-directed RNA polymerase specialized sigma24 family protein